MKQEANWQSEQTGTKKRAREKEKLIRMREYCCPEKESSHKTKTDMYLQCLEDD